MCFCNHSYYWRTKIHNFFFTFIAGDQGKHTKIVWLGCYRSHCRQLRMTGLMNIAVLVLTNGHTFEKTQPKNT